MDRTTKRKQLLSPPMLLQLKYKLVFIAVFTVLLSSAAPVIHLSRTSDEFCSDPNSASCSDAE
ncbi:hypothetical protein D9758_017388 [Tetrapyrgos nigripes]|uniref:Uncharacterized protein n=1 Tax=Tetrapyrgos nigripes TaxID=182062 RepID=A0A8H5C4V7_9AGAR|nr:hypothetical protein D9758_017388 [Tetrapyrgos nigripes]